jgi:hypothetical protein
LSSFGFAFTAAGEAFLDADANIAAAFFMGTPSFLAMDFCAVLKDIKV